MTRAEKAGLKAYPENISYSSVYDTMYDYNAEKRRIFVEGYEQGCKDTIDHPSGGELLYVLNKGVKQGYKDAVEKAYEWLRNNHADIYLRYIRGYEADDEIELLKKYMEEHQ